MELMNIQSFLILLVKFKGEISQIDDKFTEPLELSLDMEHFLNVIKEISVTDYFLSMDKNTRGCQVESYDECTTRIYLSTILNKCQCLPFNMRLTKDVVSTRNETKQ